jgi:hypothetical protein
MIWEVIPHHLCPVSLSAQCSPRRGSGPYLGLWAYMGYIMYSVGCCHSCCLYESGRLLFLSRSMWQKTLSIQCVQILVAKIYYFCHSNSPTLPKNNLYIFVIIHLLVIVSCPWEPLVIFQYLLILMSLLSMYSDGIIFFSLHCLLLPHWRLMGQNDCFAEYPDCVTLSLIFTTLYSSTYLILAVNRHSVPVICSNLHLFNRLKAFMWSMKMA